MPAGCGPVDRSAATTDVLGVTVSIVPQKYFLERIGGDRVAVNVMVEPGANPATYEPRPSQLKALREAAAYFRIGVPFEGAWMKRLAAVNPGMHIVDTAEGIERMPMADHHHHGDDAQAAEDAGVHGQADPHIWLSPRLVRVQAETICKALCELDPAHAAHYSANLEAFREELAQLDDAIRERFRDTPRRTFLVFHPSWGYFARDYGLEMISVEVGGQEPSAAELRTLVERARGLGIRAIVVQPEFSMKTARTLAEQIDGELVVISPLAPDWPDNLRRAAAAIAGILRGEESRS